MHLLKTYLSLVFTFVTRQQNYIVFTYPVEPLYNVHFAGLLIFRAVADPRNSGVSAKSREIPKKTRNTAKSARNISKYMSAKHI